MRAPTPRQFSKVKRFNNKTHRKNRCQCSNPRSRYDLRGLSSTGNRINDRGELSLDIINNNGTWELATINVISFERAENTRKPAFVDATEELGLDKLPIDDRKEAIRRGGYALALSDFDNDNNVDMLVGNYGPVRTSPEILEMDLLM